MVAREKVCGREGNSMKILQAKEMMKAMRGAFIRVGIAVPGLLLYMWILPIFIDVPRFFYTIVIVTIVLIIYLSGIFPSIKIYCTHWIKYGDGRVIIKRARKELVNGRPAGKWKIGEEEFLLEDMEKLFRYIYEETGIKFQEAYIQAVEDEEKVNFERDGHAGRESSWQTTGVQHDEGKESD